MTSAEIARAVLLGQRQTHEPLQPDFWQEDAEQAAKPSRAPLSPAEAATFARRQAAVLRWRAEKPGIRGPRPL